MIIKVVPPIFWVHLSSDEPQFFFIFYFFDLFQPMLYISNIFASCVCVLVC